MQDYRVEIDIYHGPLDLLLYLIRRDEVEINDIPIHHITSQYLQYAETIRHLDINIAGEFLVMAASLMELKSAMLTPLESLTDGQGSAIPTSENPDDPRYELVQQLLAYKRFKDAAGELDDRRTSFASRFPRIPVIPDFEDDDVPNLDMEDVQIWDLVEAFNRLMEQTNVGALQHEVMDDDTPIELHAADIIDRLQRDGGMTLQAMFVGRKSVAEMLGLFIATLELIRQHRVYIEQSEVAGDINLKMRPEEEWISNEFEYTDPNAEVEEGAEGEASEEKSTVVETKFSQAKHDVQNVDAFDWPDEDSRKRYARRQARRAKGEEVKEDVELEEDIAALEAQEDVAALSDVIMEVNLDNETQGVEKDDAYADVQEEVVYDNDDEDDDDEIVMEVGEVDEDEVVYEEEDEEEK